MRLPCYLTLLALLLVSCSDTVSTPGEALRLLAEPLPSAFIDEAYSANLRVVGGLPPYRFELSSGALPPGITLQGGTLRGTATSPGDYRFTVTVSDANLSRTFMEYRLSVVAPPPPALTLNVPTTEIQRPVTLRAEVQAPRGLEALRTRIRWDASRFAFVEGSLRRSRRDLVLFYQLAEGMLQVDLAVLGGQLEQDQRLFEFQLAPREVSTLALESDTEFISRGDRHHFAQRLEGRRPPPVNDAADAPPRDDGDDTGADEPEVP